MIQCIFIWFKVNLWTTTSLSTHDLGRVVARAAGRVVARAVARAVGRAEARAVAGAVAGVVVGAAGMLGIGEF
jgi:hypothetical protein